MHRTRLNHFDTTDNDKALEAAGLEIVADVMKTQSVLISNPATSHTETVSMLHKRIKGVLAAQRMSMLTYNVPREKLQDALKITPGQRSATVSPLCDGEWVAVQALVAKKLLSEKMDELEGVGAVDILVFKLDNCRV